MKFWYAVEKAAIETIKDLQDRMVGKIGFQFSANTLWIVLPSGRRLAYIKQKLQPNRFGRMALTFEGLGANNKWMRGETYSGKVIENITQATARDLLAEAMRRMELAGLDIVDHICCYGQDGQPISSKIVYCKAQDIGFTGIANINTSYQYTHVDVRTGSKWYGDETKGNSSVTSDFYQYFGIQKETVETIKGIDVSVHNGDIDWKKVKADGIQFAILRAGYGRELSQKDKKFKDNYAGAKAVGIPVGAYWYSYATTVEETKIEAKVCIEILKDKQFEFPIFFDQEEKAILDTGKENCSAMVRAFCDELEKDGYWAGLYTSRSILSMHIENDIKTRYALLIAEWGDKLNYSGAVGIWQYSDKGSVNGISGAVDLDISYVDYAAIVKVKGLNGFGQSPSPEPDNKVNVTVQIGNANYKGALEKV